jgi:hypothetical protein
MLIIFRLSLIKWSYHQHIHQQHHHQHHHHRSRSEEFLFNKQSKRKTIVYKCVLRYIFLVMRKFKEFIYFLIFRKDEILINDQWDWRQRVAWKTKRATEGGAYFVDLSYPPIMRLMLCGCGMTMGGCEGVGVVVAEMRPSPYLSGSGQYHLKVALSAYLPILANHSDPFSFSHPKSPHFSPKRWLMAEIAV